MSTHRRHLPPSPPALHPRDTPAVPLPAPHLWGEAESLDERIAGLPRVFTRADAAAARIGVDVLKRALRERRVERIGYDQYVLAGARDSDLHLERLRVRLARFGTGVVFAHRTAAALHGLRTPFLNQPADERIWLLRSPIRSSPNHRGDIALLPASFEPTHVANLNGVLTTTLPRTVMDLARGCRLERALIPIDHALTLGVQPAALVELAQYMKGWPGTRVFGPAIEHARSLSESGLESLARGVIVVEGLPEPELQYAVSGLSRKRYRADMAWPTHRLILEIDGREKYPSIADVFAEKRREDDLRRADWQVMRWTYEDFMTGGREGITWLKRALLWKAA